MNNVDFERIELVKMLENFLNGSGGKWDWDDFLSRPPLQDPKLETIRQRCAGLADEFPPTKPGHYCNDAGLNVLRSYVKELRG